MANQEDIKKLQADQELAQSGNIGRTPSGFVDLTSGQMITANDLATINPPVIARATQTPLPDISNLAKETATTPSGAVIDPVTGKLISGPPTPKVDLFSEIEQATSRMLGREAETEARVGEAVAPLEQELVKLQKQIRLNEADVFAAREQARERGETLEFSRGEEARVAREGTIEALRLSALAEALQSNYSIAERQARRAIEAQFAIEKRDVEIKRQNIIDNYDQMTAAQKKRADQVLLRLDENDKFIQQKISEREGIDKVAIEAVRNGITNSEILQKIQSAPTLLEANRIAELNRSVIPTAIGAEPEIKATAAQRVAAGYASRIQDADQIIGEIGSKFTGTFARFPLPEGLKSEDRKRLEQAERNFVNSVLRRESGAAISETEFDSARLQYFPQRGDTQKVLEQKSRNRTIALQALKLEAGQAFEQLQGALPNILDTVEIGGRKYPVGSIIENSRGQRGRIEADGTITIL